MNHRPDTQDSGDGGVGTGQVLRHRLLQYPSIWLRQFVEELRTCRACGQRVCTWDDVCRHCGAGHPVRIGCSRMVVVTAVASEAILLGLCWL
jgi:hypothetical protein